MIAVIGEIAGPYRLPVQATPWGVLDPVERVEQVGARQAVCAALLEHVPDVGEEPDAEGVVLGWPAAPDFYARMSGVERVASLCMR
nr:hypothetical protein [Mycolicibacterium hassiacum]